MMTEFKIAVLNSLTDSRTAHIMDIVNGENALTIMFKEVLKNEAVDNISRFLRNYFGLVGRRAGLPGRTR